MAFGAESHAANRPEQRALATLGAMGAIRFCDNLSRQVQPPDAENRMSGGVGGVTGAIPLPPPDPRWNGLNWSRCCKIGFNLQKYKWQISCLSKCRWN
jgi:hypothetical protein